MDRFRVPGLNSCIYYFYHPLALSSPVSFRYDEAIMKILEEPLFPWSARMIEEDVYELYSLIRKIYPDRRRSPR